MTKSLKQQTKQMFKELKEMEDYLHHMKMDIACMISDRVLELGIDSTTESEWFGFSENQDVAWTNGDVNYFTVADLEDYIKILQQLGDKHA